MTFKNYVNNLPTHSYLDYACDSGKLSVNISRKEVRFTHHDLSMGNGTFQMGVSHINSTLCHVVETYMGINWKLNIQQYVIPYSGSYNMPDYNIGDYMYIDGNGQLHRFVKYDPTRNKYVDATGSGMLLVVDYNGSQIQNTDDSTLYFNSDGQLRRIAMNGNRTSILKDIIFNSLGQPIKYYDTRSTGDKERYIKFEYLNNKLYKMSLISKGNELESIYYNYDGENLKSTYYFVKNVLADVAIFKYDSNSNLTFTSGTSGGQALKIDYLTSQINVYKGIAKLKLQTLNETATTNNYSLNEEPKIGISSNQSLYISNEEIYLGDDVYLFDIVHDDKLLNDCFDSSSFNSTYAYEKNIIHYVTDYFTNVTNNKNICYRYYFDIDGVVTSNFEVEGDELLTLTQDTGYQLMTESNDANQSINRKRIMFNLNMNQVYYMFNSTNSILDDELFMTEAEKEDITNYTLSFYVRLKNPNISYAKVVTRVGSYCTDRTTINPKAYYAWQYVEIPIRIVNYDNMETVFVIGCDVECSYDLANIRIKPYTRNTLCLKNQDDYFTGNDCMNATLTYTNGSSEQLVTNQDIYLTNSDILQTYKNYCLYKDFGFDLVCCGGKWRIPNVKSITFNINRGQSYTVEMNDSFVPGLRVKNPIDNVITYTYYDYTEQYYLNLTKKVETHKSNTEIAYEYSKQDYQGRVMTSVDRYGKKTINKYDNYGNLLSTTMAKEEDFNNDEFISDRKRFYLMYVYDDESGSGEFRENPQYVKNEEFTVKYTYDEKGLLTGIKNDSEAYQDHNYDSINRLSGISSNNSYNQILYDEYGKLVGYKDNLNQYNFTYDEYGSIALTSINNAQNLYEENVEFGINDQVISTNHLTGSTAYINYNKYGNVENINEGNANVTFTYQDKNVKICNDSASNYTDQSSTLLKVTEVYDGNCGSTTTITYDKDNEKKKIETVRSDGNTLRIEKEHPHTTSYYMGTQSHKTISAGVDRITNFYNCYNENNIFPKFSFEYEYHPVVGAVSKRKSSNMTVEYSFENNDKAHLYSMAVQTINYNAGGNGIKQYYNYDENMNIIKYASAGSILGNVSYEYDSLNRIYKEGNLNQNIDFKYEYTDFNRLKNVYRNGSLYKTFTYDDLGRLKSYTLNGVPHNIYYNGNNLNPISINNTTSLSWERNGMLSQYGRYNFKYDASGLRYSKTTTDSLTYYYYNGVRLIGEDCSYGRIRYMYDQKEIVGVRFFPVGGDIVEYEYIKDATGSIIAVLKDSTIVAQYTYDAWGNIINQTVNYSDVFAQINPIRYKGYYYDAETGLYYLQNRYYNPEIGAFISPDSVDYLDPETIGGLNLYCYCNNNPVMYVDSNGHFAFFILAAIIGGVIGGIGAGVTAYADGARGWELVGWTTLGLVGGAVAGGCLGATAAWMLTGTATASVTATYYGFQSLAWAYTLGGVGGALGFIGHNIGINPNYYPVNDGFAYMNQTILQPGDYVQRIGSDGGRFVSPFFTDPFSLSLPYNQISNIYNPTIYEVLKPYQVTSGAAVPYFGQYGGGMQYNLGKTVAQLVEEGILRLVQL